jgi:hypothetical protein
LFYNYVLRNFSVASLYFLGGGPLTLIGMIRGVRAWAAGIADARPATSGQVMLAALPILVGVQMLLSFVAYDVEAEPKTAIWPLLRLKGPATPTEA